MGPQRKPEARLRRAVSRWWAWKTGRGSLDSSKGNQSHSGFEQATPSFFCFRDRPGGRVENRWRGAGLQWEVLQLSEWEGVTVHQAALVGLEEEGLVQEQKRCPRCPLVLCTHTPRMEAATGNSVGAIQSALEKGRSPGFPRQPSRRTPRRGAELCKGKINAQQNASLQL